MGHYKRNRLQNKYNELQNDKEFHTSQAKASKFGAIFAATSTATATIASLINFAEDKSENGYYLAFFAFLSAFVYIHANDTHKDCIKRAHKTHKQMRNTQRAYIKDQKKH